jgi:hypothetical protein
VYCAIRGLFLSVFSVCVHKRCAKFEGVRSYMRILQIGLRCTSKTSVDPLAKNPNKELALLIREISVLSTFSFLTFRQPLNF